MVHVLLKPGLENFKRWVQLCSSLNILRRRQWHPTPVLLPGESHGWRSLAGYGPWDRKESDTKSITFLPILKLLFCNTAIELPTSTGSLKKQESSRKTSISALLTMPKPLTVWTTINCWKFWKRWEYQTTWPASWETCMQVRKQQLEMDMEQ